MKEFELRDRTATGFGSDSHKRAGHRQGVRSWKSARFRRQGLPLLLGQLAVRSCSSTGRPAGVWQSFLLQDASAAHGLHLARELPRSVSRKATTTALWARRGVRIAWGRFRCRSRSCSRWQADKTIKGAGSTRAADLALRGGAASRRAVALQFNHRSASWRGACARSGSIGTRCSTGHAMSSSSWRPRGSRSATISCFSCRAAIDPQVGDRGGGHRRGAATRASGPSLPLLCPPPSSCSLSTSSTCSSTRLASSTP